MLNQLWQLDATELAGLTRSGKVSCREVVLSALQRLHAVNPSVNAITLSLDEEALAAADAADRALRAGASPGLLYGVPVTTKINTDQLGCPTDDGLINFAKLMPKEDSPVIARLRSAGAIIIGRTNSPAFGIVFDTDNLLHGKTHNAWDRTIMCGGSSGGAAAAVATGIGPIAQCNDMGGSVRWPAYCNGVVGLRPSPGLLPWYNSTYHGGLVFCEQLMTVHGAITRSVRDARLMLDVMKGVDVHDPVTVPVTDFRRHRSGPLRVGLVTGENGSLAGEMHPQVVSAVRRAGAHLTAAGYQVDEVEPPLIDKIVELWKIIVGKELSTSLHPLLGKFVDPLMASSVNSLAALTSGIDLPAYISSLCDRDHVIRQWQLFMEHYPIVILPPCTAPSLPLYPALDPEKHFLASFRALSYQMLSPVLGFPALAMPVSITPEAFSGRPLGVQILAPRYGEDLCLEAGEIIEAHEGRRVPIDPAK